MLLTGPGRPPTTYSTPNVAFSNAWCVLKFDLFFLWDQGANDEGNKTSRQASREDGRAHSWAALRAGHTGWGGGGIRGGDSLPEGCELAQAGGVVSELRCPVIVLSLSHI